MTCYNPLIVFFGKEIGGDKKHYMWSVPKAQASPDVIARADNPDDEFVQTVPCRRCIGCRMQYAKEWAIRCYHESTLHDDNCFLTLTYNEFCLPRNGTLVKKHVQDFLKRLRFMFKNTRIRYYYCGEYGEKYGRPHYHLLLFGFDFPDKQLLFSFHNRNYYTSEICSKLWPLGNNIISDVTFESSSYVARYIMKKQYGDTAAARYDGRLPEYTNCSLKPGIGADFVEKYLENIYQNDRVSIRGRQFLPPKYYDKVLEKHFPVWAEWLKSDRKERFANAFDNTIERLAAREICAEERMKFFERTLEKEL